MVRVRRYAGMLVVPGMRWRLMYGVRRAHREKPSRLIGKDYVCFEAQEVVS